MPLRVVPRRDRKLNRLIKAAPTERIRRSDRIYDAGTDPSHLVLVREGHVCLSDPSSAASVGRVQAVVGPWEIAGEEILASGAEHGHIATAGQGCTVQRLDAGRVIRVLTTSRVTRNAFLAAQTSDLALARHLRSGGATTGVRVASVLVDLFARLGSVQEHGLALPIRITHQTVGDLAGAHRSTVTTLLNEWLYRGWLDDRDRRLSLPSGSKLLAIEGVLRPNVLNEHPG